jgi:hypothetical protein
VGGAGPSSYVRPQLYCAGQLETSAGAVQPPQVHQQRLESAASLGFAGHPPGAVVEMLGIVTPDCWTSWIHCRTSGESVGGGLSSGG